MRQYQVEIRPNNMSLALNVVMGLILSQQLFRTTHRLLVQTVTQNSLDVLHVDIQVINAQLATTVMFTSNTAKPHVYHAATLWQAVFGAKVQQIV